MNTMFFEFVEIVEIVEVIFSYITRNTKIFYKKISLKIITMYYKTSKSSKTGTQILELIDRAAQARLEISQYLKSLGALPGVWGIKKGSLYASGFEFAFFDFKPNPNIWERANKNQKSYKPSKFNYEGKKIIDRMNSVPTVYQEDINSILQIPLHITQVSLVVGSEIGFKIPDEYAISHRDCTVISYNDYLKI